MKICAPLTALLTTGLLVSVLTTEINAALLTWVSGTGDDSNPCARASPCLTFQGALTNTNANGQISVLDPGDFAPVTIAQAVTIDGNAEPSIIIADMNEGIIISAGSDDVVILRHISLNGVEGAEGPGTGGLVGIQFNSGKQLIIEDCTITGFLTAAVRINPTNAGDVVIRNTSISNCPIGVQVQGTIAPVNVALDKVTIQNTTTALTASFGHVSIDHSIITQNGTGALSMPDTQIDCTNSLFSSNDIALVADGTIRVSDNDFFDNATLFSGSGEIATANNNRQAGNGSVGAATSSIVFK